MKRILLGTLAFGLVLGAYAISGGSQGPKSADGKIQVAVDNKNPWTHLRINENADTFHFAIVSDRTGAHRARIFSEAVDRLNLMQPAFVISVGDLIEGYSKESAVVTEEWKEFDAYVNRLQMPFFYVPGNHDLSNPLQVKLWQERFGRTYYHFVFRNVLFLVLNGEDTPDIKTTGPRIGAEQIAYVQKALRDNPTASWTMVFMHRPLWTSLKLEETGWLEVEKSLQDRPFTVFVGHEHVYQKYVRNGKSYYQLATTGGGSKMRGVPYGEFDQFVWVTMKKGGPVLANVLLDGVLPENLTPPISDETGMPIKNRKEVYVMRGKVLFKGQIVPQARVALYALPLDPKIKFPRPVADGVVDWYGGCTMSTYAAFDGVPAGEYIATVTLREPPINEATGSQGRIYCPALRKGGHKRSARAYQSRASQFFHSEPDALRKRHVMRYQRRLFLSQCRFSKLPWLTGERRSGYTLIEVCRRCRHSGDSPAHCGRARVLEHGTADASPKRANCPGIGPKHSRICPCTLAGRSHAGVGVGPENSGADGFASAGGHIDGYDRIRQT